MTRKKIVENGEDINKRGQFLPVKEKCYKSVTKRNIGEKRNQRVDFEVH